MMLHTFSSSLNKHKTRFDDGFKYFIGEPKKDKTIRRLCRKVQIAERSMHKLRKTYASYLLSTEVSEKIVHSQLGHADISTTQKAYHLDIYDTNDKVNALKDLEVGYPPFYEEKKKAQPQCLQVVEP